MNTLFNIEKVLTMLRESGTMSSSRPKLVVNARGDVTKTTFHTALDVMTGGGGALRVPSGAVRVYSNTFPAAGAFPLSAANPR